MQELVHSLTLCIVQVLHTRQARSHACTYVCTLVMQTTMHLLLLLVTQKDREDERTYRQNRLMHLKVEKSLSLKAMVHYHRQKVTRQPHFHKRKKNFLGWPLSWVDDDDADVDNEKKRKKVVTLLEYLCLQRYMSLKVEWLLRVCTRCGYVIRDCSLKAKMYNF